MVERPASAESLKIIDQAFEGRSVPIARRVILYHYFDTLINRLKGKSQVTVGAELDQNLEEALKDYTKDYTEKIYKQPDA